MRAASLPSSMNPSSIADKQTADGVYDRTEHVLETIEDLGPTNLVTIGGDDTLSFSSVLFEHGLPLIAIPKTMDNDVPGTEYCIGFSSAVTRATELIDRQRTTLGSHERIGVFRICGRGAEFTALCTADVTSTRCLIPEGPYDLEALAELLKQDHDNNPSRYAMVITAEGAIWDGAVVADVGEPDMLDSMVATTLANVAMDLIRDGIGGRMVAIRDGKYSHVSLAETAKHARRVDASAAYDADRFRPTYSERLGHPLPLTPSLEALPG